MKYIFKSEIALYSKFTIAVAVRKALLTISSFFTIDLERNMILKTYNKLNSHREVDISEAISHLLDFSDHYINKNFQHIHTTLLLQYFKDCFQQDLLCNIDTFDTDSQIIVDNRKFSITSHIDNYIYREKSLSDYCLYNYYSLFYRRKKLSDIRFDSRRQQHLRHTQFLRRSSVAAI